MWATKPTPQASCSFCGSYRPCSAGTEDVGCRWSFMGTPSVRGRSAVKPFLLPAARTSTAWAVELPKRRAPGDRRNSEYTRRINGIANKCQWYDPYYQIGALNHFLIGSTSKRCKRKRHAKMPFLCSPLIRKILLRLRRFADLTGPAARQRRHAPVRRPRRPLTIGLAAEHPAL